MKRVRIPIKASSRFPVDRKKIRKTVKEILNQNNIQGGVEVSIAIVGNRKMKALNKEYLDREVSGEILSFPLENTEERMGMGFASDPDKVLRLGDLVISYPQVLKKAAKKNILVDEEIEALIRHGMKHLLGVRN